MSARRERPIPEIRPTVRPARRSLLLIPGLCFALTCHLPLLNPHYPGGTVITTKAPGVNNTYWFCPDGTIGALFSLSNVLNHRRYGHWSAEGDHIRIVWNRELGSRGVGQPFHCPDNCVFADYVPFQNTLLEEDALDFGEWERRGSLDIEGFEGVCDPFWQ